MSIMRDKEKKSFLIGGGEIGDLIRAKDWEKTSLGDMSTWPQSLLTTLGILLNSRFPMFLFWGPDLLCFYNDAYRPSLGESGKHPMILGSPAEDYWPETWANIKPLIDQVIQKGEATWHENQLLPIYRNQRLEDVYWTFSYSPVFDEMHRINGVFVACYETTEEVVSQSKLKESKDQLQFAMDAAELSTFEINVLTNTFTGNNRLKEWHGLSEDNEFDMAIGLDTVLPEDKENLQKAIQRAQEYDSGGMLDMEYSIENPKTQERRFVRVKGRASFGEDRKAYKINGILIDVSKQVESRRKIEESEERFRTMAESTDILIAVGDDSSNATYFNKAWIDFTGRSMDELINFGWTDLLHPDDKESFLSLYINAFENKAFFTDEFRVLDQEKNYKYILLKASPRFHVDGSFMGYISSSIDITERKAVEEALHLTNLKEVAARKEVENSEFRIRTLIQNAPFPLGVYVGKEMRIEFLNQAMLDAWEKDQKIIGQLVSDILPDFVNKGAMTLLNNVYDTGNAVYFNNQRLDLVVDGVLKTNYYNWSLLPLYDTNGKIYGVMNSAANVTDLNIAKEKIEENEERFQTLANSIQNLAWMANGDGWLFWYNQRWYDYTGTTFEDMMGWGWEKVHHPQHIARVKDFVKEAWTKNKPFELTFPIKSVDGEYRWFLTRAYPITNAEGEVIRWVGTNTDINEQKNAEDQFRLLAETLPQLVWVTDEKGKREFASRKWFEYTGVEAIDAESWKQIVHPDDYDYINGAWAKSLESGNSYKFDVRLKSKTGEYRWHTVNGEAVLGEDNKIAKWVGAFTDTHSEKTFLQELARQVESRTKELNKAKEILEEKNIDLEKMNKELESFAYVSSHDLQEPLRKIHIFASRLAAHEEEKLSDKGKEYLLRMQDAAKRMQQLIQDLLAFSRINTADRQFELSNFNSIIDEVKYNLRDELQHKEAVIEVSEIGNLNIIRFQFRQLLINLVSNSLKFAKKDVKPHIKIQGNIASGASLNNPKLSPNKQYLHITFEDNGIGFEEEYNDKIFEVFQRLYSREQYEGTGIGLSIVKKIVENHHGIIQARGNLGVGAEFHIYLPTQL